VRPNKEVQLEFTLPIPGGDSKFANVCIDETGLVVQEVLNDKDRYLGKKIALVGDDVISPNEMAAILSKRIFYHTFLPSLLINTTQKESVFE
jgi:hypothetical protein